MSYEPIDIELINKTKYIPDFLEISYSKNFEKAGLGIIAKKNIKKEYFLEIIQAKYIQIINVGIKIVCIILIQ